MGWRGMDINVPERESRGGHGQAGGRECKRILVMILGTITAMRVGRGPSIGDMIVESYTLNPIKTPRDDLARMACRASSLAVAGEMRT
jgi:hypothetical protein